MAKKTVEQLVVIALFSLLACGCSSGGSSPSAVQTEASPTPIPTASDLSIAAFQNGFYTFAIK